MALNISLWASGIFGLGLTGWIRVLIWRYRDSCSFAHILRRLCDVGRVLTFVFAYCCLYVHGINSVVEYKQLFDIDDSY
jgi:hypothetical protein